MKKFLFVSFLLSTMLFAGVNPKQDGIFSIDPNKIVSVESEISVYPNPATEFVNIVSKKSATISAVKFYNILGSEVLSKNVRNEKKARINVRNFKRGKYLVRVHFSDGTIAYTNLVKV